MTKSIERTGVYIMVFVALTFSQQVFSEYLEGIDTTDENGWGLDSAFRITNMLSGQKLVCYTDHQGRGVTRHIFRYSFEEICLAADSTSLSSILLDPGPFVFSFPYYFYCFVVRKDSCFSKVQVIKRFLLDTNNNDWRHIYKYGTNTTPLNRTMIHSNYDRSVRYKPNNLAYIDDVNADKYRNNFVWEPPLPNDNHLQGYIIYLQKTGVAIDTSAPINLAQWDSVCFTDTKTIALPYSHPGSYYNIVAVYAEGRTDFLKGWSQISRPSGITNGFSIGRTLNTLSIHNTQCGAFISSSHWAGMSILTIVDCTGRRLTRFSNLTGNHFFWNTSQRQVPPGLYLLRAEFPDKSAMTRPFTITR